MSDFEIRLGAGLIGSTQNIEGATRRTLIEVIRDAPLKLEDVGGGPGKTAAENDAAFAKLLAHFDAVTSRGTIQLLGGVYLISEPVTPPTFARNLIIQGHGSDISAIRQTKANKNGIALPAGLNLNLTLREFLLYGAGTGTSYSGTGTGVYQPEGQGNDSFAICLDRLWILNWGGDGAFLGNSFTSAFHGVHVNYCGGNGIVGNGNTVLAQDCYMHNLPEPGAAGYRFIAGQATLINCNGLDSGGVWGRFGRSNGPLSRGDGDGMDEYCLTTLIGCNIEDFGKIGLDNRNGILSIDRNCRFTGALNATDLVAIRTRSHNGEGCLGSTSRIALKGTSSTWKNGKSIHALNNQPPFSQVFGAGADAELSYWDVATGTAKTMPVDGLAYGGAVIAGAASRWFRVQRDLYVPEMFRAGGGVYLSALANFANDAAAAAGGILVGQAYRTGSAVKVRVA